MLTNGLAGPTRADIEHAADMVHRAPSRGRARNSPLATSLRIEMSRAWSATTRLRRVFSASSSLSRFMSSDFMPPYWFRQRLKVTSETPSRVATSPTGSP